MKRLSRIFFPSAVTALALAGAVGFGAEAPRMAEIPMPSASRDTVVYPEDGYKLHRVGDFEELADSLRGGESDSLVLFEEEDTLPRLSARDTIKAPDSLRLTDPFRYKYYVALLDSLTHIQVRDSLIHRVDSLRKIASNCMVSSNIEGYNRYSEMVRCDSLDWRKLDSLYSADSSAVARAKFLAWYNSLSKQERRKYDIEQKATRKMAEMDSIRAIKEDAKALRDSITENTPRILETFAIPDSMYYKRIISWKLDQDFQDLKVAEPDTSYNHHYYDYVFQRNDVNSSWLGVAGSPVQYYNYFNRKSDEGIEFYDAFESWSFSPRTIDHYNTKVPHTELAYFGTLLSKESKESDNIHIFTTQNILPGLNFSLLFDRWGGGGILSNEGTVNKTGAVQLNYLGRKYMAHVGYIHNGVEMQENGGITDNYFIRDTTLEAREIPVNLPNAQSKTTKHTVYLDQQLRIPFTFINKIKSRRDTSFAFNPDSLDKDITTAFIGHSSELSIYKHEYNDKINDTFGQQFYNNVFNYNLFESDDSLHVTKVDNKLFIRLQPWASDAIVSKIDVGIGDLFKNYASQDTVGVDGKLTRCYFNEHQNSVYLYAGARGQWNKYLNWNAKADYVLFGHDAADFGVNADIDCNFYPFRRHRKSPVNINAHFETSLRRPTYYQQRMFSNHFSWNNDFNKISTTKIQGGLNIPHWNLKLDVGYALLSGNIYYDDLGIVRQNSNPMSVFTASLEKNFKAGPVHFDNRAMLQLSSDSEVMPLPLASLNARWYFQFVVQRDAEKIRKIMEMQIGINAWYNTQWYAPAWNPNLGVFHNQHTNLYENGPYFDIFVNVQWKRACIFIKYQNFIKGWPMKKKDYFCSDHHIITQDGMEGLKLGLYWPFYTQPLR